MLVRLDGLSEVQKSFSNHSGTLLRVTATPGADGSDVAHAVAKVLESEGRAQTMLTGDESTNALRMEEWRDSSRIEELTAIEIRTLAIRYLGYALPVLVGLVGAVMFWRKRRKVTAKR